MLKSGSLNLLELEGPAQSCTGIDFRFDASHEIIIQPIRVRIFKWELQVRNKVNQSHYRPEVPRGFQEVKTPDYVTMSQNGGNIFSLTHRPHFNPRKYSWYSFLLEAVSTPGP